MRWSAEAATIRRVNARSGWARTTPSPSRSKIPTRPPGRAIRRSARMFSVRLRVLRLEFDVLLASLQQSSQVAPDEQEVGQPTERPERQAVPGCVDHACAGRVLLEAVLVAPCRDGSTLNLVHEPPGPVVVDDLGGQPPPDPKMA